MGEGRLKRGGKRHEEKTAVEGQRRREQGMRSWCSRLVISSI